MFTLGPRSRAELVGVDADLVAVVEAALAASPVDFAVHDGTRTLAQTGSITWTVPTTWKSASLQGDRVVTDVDAPPESGFWARFIWSTALSATVEIDELWSLNRDTTRGYYRLGQEYLFSFDRRSVGSFEMVLASGTDTAEITYVRSVY